MLLAGATVAGAAATAMTAFVLVPSVTPFVVHPPPAAGIAAPARPHTRHRLARTTTPAAAPSDVPAGGAPQPQAGPSPAQLPIPLPSVSASASVTPGGTSTVQVTLPAPAPAVSTCIPLPLLGDVCLAA